MNKKLSDIFNEAEPAELDGFCETLQSADVPPQILASVKEKTFEKAGFVTKHSKPTGIWWRVAAIAACLCLAIAAVVMLAQPEQDDPGLFVPGDGTQASDIVQNSTSPTDESPVSTQPTDDPADNTDPIDNTEPVTKPPENTEPATRPPENTEPPVTPPDVAEPDPGYSGPSDIITVSDPKVFQDKLKGNSLEFVTGSSVNTGGISSAAPPMFEFGYSGLVVKARVVENYEDTYYKLDVNAESAPKAYRLILLEVLEEVHSANMPRYVLYLIPKGYFLDLSVYDSLLISMRQIGTENYVLRNGTKNQIEAFSIPVFADWEDRPDLGDVMAFTDGVLDRGLWENRWWRYGLGYLDLPESDPCRYFAHPGETEQAIIERIKAINTTGGAEILTLNFTSQEAKDAIAYVKPFENGVFSQEYLITSNILRFRRFINGCQTEEVITINLKTEEVTYSEVRYTPEDIAGLADLSEYVSRKAQEYQQETPVPPHTDTTGKELRSLNLYAWYFKLDGKLYGVVKTTWIYKEDTDGWYVLYYDDDHILFDMTEATAQNISRENLIALAGYRNITGLEYNVAFGGEM